MPSLFGHYYSREDLLRYVADLSQIGGVEMLSLDEADGLRVLEFRTGTGFAFMVEADDSLDVIACEYQGLSFSMPGEFSTSLRGAGQVTSYGGRWDDDDYVLEASGQVTSDSLTITRRYSAWLGESRYFLRDEFVNRGEHAAEYPPIELVIAFPLLDENAELIAPLPAEAPIRFTPPQDENEEWAIALDVAGDPLREVPIALVNHHLGDGRGVYFIYNRGQMGACSLTFISGKGQYRAVFQLMSGSPVPPGEGRAVDLEVGALENAQAIREFRQKVESVRGGRGQQGQ